MNKIAFIFASMILIFSISVQVTGAQEDPIAIIEEEFENFESNNKSTNGFRTSSGLDMQISSLPEAKLAFSQNFIFPVLQSSSPLTSGNNLRLNLAAEITPVSMDGIFKAVLTPIAFLEFSAGGKIGTGWPFDAFNAVGIGLNLADENNIQVYDGSPFDAILYKGWAGGTFQFDLAAVVPGDWNHIVFLTYHELNYRGNTRAKANEAWYYENDSGENCNGFNYYGNFVLGYQMPLSPVLKMIALMAEMDLYLYDTPDRKDWGDDLIRWHFSHILQFEISKKFGFAIITQFRTMRNFTNFDLNEAKRNDEPLMYYRSRILDKDNPYRVEFFRVAGIFSYSF